MLRDILTGEETFLLSKRGGTRASLQKHKGGIRVKVNLGVPYCFYRHLKYILKDKPWSDLALCWYLTFVHVLVKVLSPFRNGCGVIQTGSTAAQCENVLMSTLIYSALCVPVMCNRAIPMILVLQHPEVPKNIRHDSPQDPDHHWFSTC